MRILDIAVASGYAAVCLSLVIAINPLAPRESAVVAAAQSRLDSAVSAYIQHVGLPFLATSSPRAICLSAVEASNATLILDVIVEGAGCGPAPPGPSPLAVSSLTLNLPGRVVVVEAWFARR
jgi:hypothetical protein